MISLLAPPGLSTGSLLLRVRMAGFEPATSRIPSGHATKLRYILILTPCEESNLGLPPTYSIRRLSS